MTAPRVVPRGWWQQIREDLAPHLWHLVFVVVGVAVAIVWGRVLDWPLTGLALLALALIAALQEARILAVHNRLGDHLEDVELRRGPIAPAYQPEPPWMPAEPVTLAPIEPFSGAGTVRPSPFPADPTTEPIAQPEPPATVPAAAIVDAEWEQMMADADEFIAGLHKDAIQ